MPEPAETSVAAHGLRFLLSLVFSSASPLLILVSVHAGLVNALAGKSSDVGRAGIRAVIWGHGRLLADPINSVCLGWEGAGPRFEDRRRVEAAGAAPWHKQTGT